MLIFTMKKGLYLIETYSPVAHHHYCLNKGKSEPLQTRKKEKSYSQATLQARLGLHSLLLGLTEKFHRLQQN